MSMHHSVLRISAGFQLTALPRKVGQYRILSLLGGGGMGMVYLGQGRTGLVAVKVIRPEMARDASFRSRF